MTELTYPYALPPLPYAYDALEPYIDAETMHYHHDKHFQTYVNNLNAALKPYPYLQTKTLAQLLRSPQALPRAAATAILHNGGGAYNHNLFFNGLAPASAEKHAPAGRLEQQINRDFKSFDNFKTAFNAQAGAVFGSGWTALAQNLRGTLQIVSFPNQDTLITKGLRVLLLVDVWEHAYYLKYKNARADYLTAIWNVLKLSEDCAH
ncbi:superoxide dismutase [Clostridia bacterium]|nr:superoxide dismutase [Clostridia bacterium]